MQLNRRESRGAPSTFRYGCHPTHLHIAPEVLAKMRMEGQAVSMNRTYAEGEVPRDSLATSVVARGISGLARQRDLL